MLRKSIITLLLAPLCIMAQDQQMNLSVANHFFDAYRDSDFDKMASFWHDSLKFQDPVIGELYNVDDTHYGNKKVLELWKEAFQSEINYIHIDIQDQFASSNFVVTELSYELSSQEGGRTNIIRGDMFTVFKFQNGKIIEQYDFGDYFAWDRQTKSQLLGNHHVERAETPNLAVAKAYIMAYASGDPATMGNFYADNISFKDLTAKDFFKGPGYEMTGKAEVTAFWQSVLVNSKCKYVNVKIEGMFYAGSYVMLSTTFSMILPPTWTGGKENVLVVIPIKTILQIKDGKILKHYDFANYDVYQEQISLQTQ